MSQLEVDKVLPQSGTTLTLGESGDTITIPSGATLDASSGTITLPNGSVTAAKLASTAVDNTNTNSTVITGQTAETTVAGGDLVLVYDDSASALRKMTRTNLFSGVAVNGPTFRATLGTTTTLSANTFTKINFTAEDWDTNSNFASSRFTPTVAGYYQINAVFGEGLSTSGMTFYIEINKSGNRHALMQYVTASAWYTNIPISSIVFCNGTTDYIEIFAQTGDAYTNSNNTGTNYFEGAMIRSA